MIVLMYQKAEIWEVVTMGHMYRLVLLDQTKEKVTRVKENTT
jgi:hypothetical protein